MSIRVTCAKCHTRFNVSEKFAGKIGPCPKCKNKIKIPTKDQEVKVHEPELAGPKNVRGESVLKPITRTETAITGVHIAIIASLVVGFLICSLVMRFMYPGAVGFPGFLLWISAIAIAPPICFAAYTFLRDQELGSFLGKELWYRVLATAAIYALLWLAMPLGKYAFSDNYEMGSWVIALVIMLGAGGAAGMLAFDFDYLMGLVHYGLYLGICLLGRWLAGIGVLPGMVDPEAVEPASTTTAAVLLESLSATAMLVLG